MFLYNVTVKVHDSISTTWLQWLKEDHVPEVLETGCFTYARICRLLEVDDSEGPTFSIQYTAETKSDYNRYINIHAEGLRNKSFEKWGDQFIAFRSLMQIVN